MAAFIPLILEIALKAFGFFLDKSAASKENMKSFYLAVSKIADDLQSAGLKKESDKQLAALKNTEWKETT